MEIEMFFSGPVKASDGSSGRVKRRSGGGGGVAPRVGTRGVVDVNLEPAQIFQRNSIFCIGK